MAAAFPKNTVAATPASTETPRATANGGSPARLPSLASRYGSGGPESQRKAESSFPQGRPATQAVKYSSCQGRSETAPARRNANATTAGPSHQARPSFTAPL